LRNVTDCFAGFSVIKVEEEMAKKMKGEPDDSKMSKELEAIEKLIKKQTTQLFKVRDAISHGNKEMFRNILFANNSGMVEGLDSLLDRCADFLTFGALAKCQRW